MPTSEHQAQAIESVETMFGRLDSNGNGYVSRAEAKASEIISHEWTQIDRDGDGRLDRAEYAQFHAKTEAGVNYMKPGERSYDVPATEHQKDVTRK